MKPHILLTISIFLFSCNSIVPKKQSPASKKINDAATKAIQAPAQPSRKDSVATTDTTSSDHLIFLLTNGEPLNSYWINKLNSIHDFFYSPRDTLGHLSLVQSWKINDSVSAIVLSHSTGTDYDEFLLSVKNKKELVSALHISDQADSDLSLGNPYYYMEYKLYGKRNLKLFKHKVVGTEGGDEKDRLIATQHWVILENGKIVKK